MKKSALEIGKELNDPLNDEESQSITKRILRESSVGAYGPLGRQFFSNRPTPTSDLRDRILSGDYFKS